MVENDIAYVLEEGAVPSSEPQSFGVIPGLYEAGVPVTVSELGLSADEMAELVAEYDFPLALASAAPPVQSESSSQGAEV